MKLFHRFFHILHGDEAHRIEPFIDLSVTFRDIIIEGSAHPHGVVGLLKKTYR
jgi:hypothetical protein